MSVIFIPITNQPNAIMIITKRSIHLFVLLTASLYLGLHLLIGLWGGGDVAHAQRRRIGGKYGIGVMGGIVTGKWDYEIKASATSDGHKRSGTMEGTGPQLMIDSYIKLPKLGRNRLSLHPSVAIGTQKFKKFSKISTQNTLVDQKPGYKNLQRSQVGIQGRMWFDSAFFALQTAYVLDSIVSETSAKKEERTSSTGLSYGFSLGLEIKKIIGTLRYNTLTVHYTNGITSDSSWVLMGGYRF